MRAFFSRRTSCGLGWESSASMVAGARLNAATRSPPTASAKLRKSVVVVTTWMRSCATAGSAEASHVAMTANRNTEGMKKERTTRVGPSMSCRLPPGDPDALRHQAMDILLRVGDRPDPAIHRHAGEPIGIKARDLLLRLEQPDHAHRCVIHRLVQVSILDVRDVIGGRLLGRTLQVFPVGGVLRVEAVDALLDVDDLGDTAIGNAVHQCLRLAGGNAALFGQQLDGLFLGLRPSLVQILIESHRDP